MNSIISHLRPKAPNNSTDGDVWDDWEVQTNEEHAEGVARLAERFAAEVGLKGWGSFVGLLHDKGKERRAFQEYIRQVNGLPANYHGEDKSHAFVGAVLSRQCAPRTYPVAAYVIAGHHAGLCDYTKLRDYLAKTVPDEITPLPAINLPAKPSTPWTAADFNHLIRMLYSCLVDADYLDTEAFMNRQQAEARGRAETLPMLLPKLEARLSAIVKNAPDTPVNRIRKQVQDVCRKMATEAPGVYSLTVPTGGGKTLSSLLWAMLHAVEHGKRRIIISIPYTSIISQTAEVLRGIFGDENVLEHHSNVIHEARGDEDTAAAKVALQKRLSAENWDFPIIVTTNVRLLESMYASHASDCRKLHNVANSVIIFDEAQTLPAEKLQPIVSALKVYQKAFGVSLLFTTASQPTLQGRHEGMGREVLEGFDAVREIVPREWKLHERLRRVNLSVLPEALDYDTIARRMMTVRRVLCIVNTRKDAAEISQHLSTLEEDEEHFHLSRMMCSEHIDHTIGEIRRALKCEDERPVRVVATQLIEAGVDIDFPYVMRQEAGLDSVLQAAGRCNREGWMTELGRTEVFCIAGRNLPKGTLTYANQARKNMRYEGDLFAPEAMEEYFEQYYHQIKGFDTKDGELKMNMKDALGKPQELMIETADRIFKLINGQGVQIVVNYGESAKIVEAFRRQPCKALYRRLGRYTVNLNEHDAGLLAESGMLEQLAEGYYYLSDPRQYDDRIGLKLDNHWLEETCII